MSLNRHATRRDLNEAEIVEALKLLGARVWRHDQPLDLLIAFRGVFMFCDIKNPAKPPSARQLTAAQAQFFADTEGCPRFVAHTAEEAIKQVQYWSKLKAWGVGDAGSG